MNNFDKIIKQKTEQFEVPFNETHWTEMDGKLNAIRTTKIKNIIFAAATIIAVVATVGYFNLKKNETKQLNKNTIVTNNLPVQNTTSEKSENISRNNNSTKKKNKAALTNPTNEQPKTNNTDKIKAAVTPSKTEQNTSVQEKIVEDDSQKSTPDNKIINAEFIVYNNKVCLGEEVSFESQENEQSVSYTWDFGDGTVSHQKNPSHSYTDSHTYSVSLTLTNKQTGKETSTTQNDVVVIMPSPKANFNFSETSLKNDDNKLKYPYTIFTVNKMDKECSYEWNFGNKKQSTTTQGKTIYKKAGNYTAVLVAKNNNTGCSSTHKEEIVIKSGVDLFAPNAFTPNNNGGNETFIPKALLGWETKFEMVILDKSGKTIFTTSDQNNPWNGKLNNKGQVLPDGIYLWKVITYDAENNPHRHHGKITMVK